MSALSRTALLLGVALLACIGPALAAAALLWRRRVARARRRSPLTSDLLRGPGHSLRVELETLRDGFDEKLLLLAIAPLLVLSIHLTQSSVLGIPENPLRILTSVFAGVLPMAWAAMRMVQLSMRMDRMRIGLDAEMAVGQELDQLMRDGAIVFHDVPGEHFNIDHVVICATGVYAVETKGRAKPIRGQGTQDATVVFDGEALCFPTWRETGPLQQAQRQARWLEQWLSRAVGAPVTASGVLAIPGWYVDRKARGSVLIYSGKSPGFLLRVGTGTFSAELMQRISHQIDQRCRNVKPAYSK